MALVSTLPSFAAPTIPEIPYTRFQLQNGLTVIVHEDHKAPIVAVAVWYHVGSADEPKGKTGFAHLFEHLMFRSEHHKGDYFSSFEKVGATQMNADTWFDRTRYYETVPTSALDMALWMESDRMGHLLGAIGSKELKAEKGIVKNEKRQSENRPYGRIEQNILSHLYPANHPYQHDTIGSMADLDAASLSDVKQWFRDYYGAANATLVLAGDITLQAAKEKAEKYFGHITRGPAVPRQQPWVTPLSRSIRGIQHDQIAQTRIIRSWVTPEAGSDAAIQLKLAAEVLGGDKTSRLYQRLVYQEPLVDNVSVEIHAFALASQFSLEADIKQGVDPARVEAIIEEEFKKFLSKGPTQDELDRIKMQHYADWVRDLETVRIKAAILADGQVYRDDPGAYKKDMQRIDVSTIASVKTVAKKWLSKGHYTLTILPASPNFNAEMEDQQVIPRGEIKGRPMAKLTPQPVSSVAKRSQIDRRQGVPTVKQFPDLHFPMLQHGKLKNGIPVILAERHTLPTTQISLLFDAGYSADQGRPLGTANFTTALMNESTQQLDSIELAKHEQKLGAIIHFSCGLDSCSATLDALNEQLAPSLALLGEMVRHPAFKPEDIERIRGQWLAKISQEKTNPTTIALRTLPQLIYGNNHAYGIPLTGSGTETSIQALTQEDLIHFHRDFIRPDNVKILVTGDTSLTQIIPELEGVFSDWQAPAQTKPEKHISTIKLPNKPQIFLIHKPDQSQSLLLAGTLVPSSTVKHNLAIQITNDAFGGTFTSRLNMNLREDKHWSYGVHSFLLDTIGQRPLLFMTSIQTDKTAEAISEIYKEAKMVIDNKPLTEPEIMKIKESKIRSLPGLFESAGAVLNAISHIVLYNRPDDYVQTLKSQIEAIHLMDIKAATQETIQPNALTWVIVGNLKKIEKSVRNLNIGTVKVLNADGELNS